MAENVLYLPDNRNTIRFVLTGFMGLTVDLIIHACPGFFSNSSQSVMMAIGGTAAIFLRLSGYNLKAHKNFNFMDITVLSFFIS